MLKHWLIELIGHTSGLSEAQLQQIEKALPRTRALIVLLTKDNPIIEQAHSLYIEAEPLIDQAMKEWQTVGPAAQILIDVISHHVDKGGSPAEAAAAMGAGPDASIKRVALWAPMPWSTRSVCTSSTEAIHSIQFTWKRLLRSQAWLGGSGLNG